MLAEKRRWLDERPELCAALAPQGGGLVDVLWEEAMAWGHVAAPEDVAEYKGMAPAREAMLREMEKCAPTGG